MRHRVLFVLILCLAAVAILGIGVSAAALDEFRTLPVQLRNSC